MLLQSLEKMTNWMPLLIRLRLPEQELIPLQVSKMPRTKEMEVALTQTHSLLSLKLFSERALMKWMRTNLL